MCGTGLREIFISPGKFYSHFHGRFFTPWRPILANIPAIHVAPVLNGQYRKSNCLFHEYVGPVLVQWLDIDLVPITTKIII